MTNSDTPAGPAGGPVPPGLDDLPEKLRVHALAKLLGRTSRDVLATLAELGIPARSAQSSVDRKAAEQVAAALVPDPTGPPEPAAAPEPVASELAVAPEPVADEPPLSFGDLATAPAATPDEGPVDVPALAPLFAPPAPVFQPPVRRTRRRGAAAEPAADAPSDSGAAPAVDGVEPAGPETVEPGDTPAGDVAPRSAPRGRGRRRVDPDETAADTTEEPVDDDRADEQADDESGDGSGRRRRRRGRRGRGRGRGGEGDTAESADDADDADADGADTDESDTTDTADESDTADETDEADTDDAETSDDAESDATRRRRRRRRRRGAGDEPGAGDENDPPNTVVRVRAPRERSDDTDGDGVQSVRGSTRLEAKRQRRRDGRDAGRRRVPILSEAEFLARREAVERSMVVRERGDRVEVGVLEDGVLVEHFITGGIGQNGDSLVGNIYLGRVQNVLPSMEAAFVDIGRGRNAVLYAGEVDWDAAGLGGRARRIEQALSSGDSVLVQVTKDPVGHKGARLTTQISLAGRFLVYVPSGGAAGISRKLPDVERKRLKDLLREIVPSEAGVIIRTASEGVTQEALERDVRRLQAQWDVVKEKSEKTGPGRPKAPVLLYEEPDMLVKVVRDQFNEDFSRLVVSGDDAWETVSNYVGHVATELAERMHRHVGPRDVFEEYRIDEQLLKALDRKVWLPSGGTLVIDRTEAMTVIDVNTGKFTGSGGNLEETVTRNNLEAAEEIVRQLRLRDIGGIIVIDFIDMVLEANRDLVLRRLTECLARDRTRHQVAEVTSLGLVQMTRKRVGGGLLEHFSTPCEHCRGRGVIISTEPVTDSRGGDRNGNGGHGDRNGGGQGNGAQGNGAQGNGGNGESGGRRRGRGRRDEPSGDRPRRLPEAITPERDEATTDVGAPAPVAEAPQLLEAAQAGTGVVEPATVESVRDDVEEVVVEQSLAAERGRRGAPDASGFGATGFDAPGEPARNGAAGSGLVGAVDGVAEGSAGGALAETAPAPATGRARRRGRVTRTAGAPAAASGETPAVAVVTVPAVRTAEFPAAPGTVAAPGSAPVVEPAPEAGSAPVVEPPPVAAPEPAAPAARPRRARRAASRPAGPPAAEPDAGSAAGAGGDPV